MSIATAISQLQTAKADIAQALEDKGIDTTGHGLSDFADDIADISTSDPRLITAVATGGDLDLSDLTGMERVYDAQFYANTANTNNLTFTSIILPQSVRSIGTRAFYNQYRLRSINIPPSVGTIGESAFNGCKALAGTITIPSVMSGTNLGDNAFQNCFSLEEVVFQRSQLTQICSNTFCYCTSLREVRGTLPTDIQTSAFQACSALESIPLSNVEYIRNNAFFQCSALESIDLSSCLYLGNSAFSSCISLKEVELPSTLTAGIGTQCFTNCTGLEKLKVKSPILGQAYNANTFNSCTSLSKVWISANTVTNNTRAFFGCTSLTDIYCEAGSLPANWLANWNETATNTSATVHWGTTEAQFDALVGA